MFRHVTEESGDLAWMEDTALHFSLSWEAAQYNGKQGDFLMRGSELESQLCYVWAGYLGCTSELSEPQFPRLENEAAQHGEMNIAKSSRVPAGQPILGLNHSSPLCWASHLDSEGLSG